MYRCNLFDRLSSRSMVLYVCSHLLSQIFSRFYENKLFSRYSFYLVTVSFKSHVLISVGYRYYCHAKDGLLREILNKVV